LWCCVVVECFLISNSLNLYRQSTSRSFSASASSVNVQSSVIGAIGWVSVFSVAVVASKQTTQRIGLAGPQAESHSW